MRLKYGSLLAGLGLTLIAATHQVAKATPYESFIDVETEDDLVDLLASGLITEETYESLSTLLARGVNLSEAGRGDLYSLPNLTYPEVDAILAYRKEQGYIGDPSDLVAAGVISEAKLLSIAAFLIIEKPGGDKYAVHGFVNVITRTSPSDFGIKTHVDGDTATPPIGLRFRMTTADHLTAGLVATTTRMRLGTVVADPNRGALIADPAGLQFHVPKVYVKYVNDDVEAIAGSFRAGFGQRLTFDNSSDYTPNGLYSDDQLIYSTELGTSCRSSAGELATSPCTGAAGDVYSTPDFRWRNGMLGAGVGFKQIKLGEGYAQAFGWASYARRSIYQYELYDRDKCSDPRNDSDPDCAAPPVYIHPDGDRLDPAATTKFATLPNMFAESIVGANFTYFADRRNYVGVTGYGGKLVSLVNGLDIGTQEWSNLVGRGGNGAVGVNFAFGRKWLDLAGEVAHSFDRIPDGAGPAEGGGGPAAIVRATATGKKKELEASFRYYSVDYVNPNARPIAASDEFEGQRVRDEVGGRLKYTGVHGNVSLRTALDVWGNITSSTPKTNVYVHVDVRATDKLTWGVWEEYSDKDLGLNGRNECFETSIEFDERGETIPCSGMKLKTIGRLRYQPIKSFVLTGQAQHALLDDSAYTDKFRHDLQFWLAGVWKATPRLSTRARVRYLNEDIADSGRMEQSMWITGEGTIKLRKKDSLRLRADLYSYLDKRASTVDRRSNPELWFWAQYELKF